jgi:hypothetical protein
MTVDETDGGDQILHGSLHCSYKVAALYLLSRPLEPVAHQVGFV